MTEYVTKIMVTMPSSSDVSGDRWAARVRWLYEQACKKLDVPLTGPGMGAVWNLFQYQYCQLADMPGRVISSPEAMLACGWPITQKEIDLTERLLIAQSGILKLQKGAFQGKGNRDAGSLTEDR
jgi:hypothetical protein